MTTLQLKHDTQTITLVKAIGEADPDASLSTVIYTPGLAAGVLYQRGIESVEITRVIPDLEGTTVAIDYRNNTGEAATETVECSEFIKPFRLRRAVRSGAYQIAAIDPNQTHQIATIQPWLPLSLGIKAITAVYGHTQKPAQIVVTPNSVEGGDSHLCTCTDYQNQSNVFPQHPALWAALDQQPLCKHVLKVRQEQGQHRNH